MSSLKNLFKPTMRDLFEDRTKVEEALRDKGFHIFGAGTCDESADISVKIGEIEYLIEMKPVTY